MEQVFNTFQGAKIIKKMTLEDVKWMSIRDQLFFLN